MDARGVLQPVGPLPARVYWIRRLLPLVLLLVLVAVIAISCSGGDAPKRSSAATLPTTSPSPSPTATMSATATATTGASPTASAPAAAGPCHAVDLAVTASTDSASYGPGTTPLLKVTVRNAGSAPCVLLQSPSRRNWTIRSGNDVIWSTVDCPKSHVEIQTRLAPNQSVVHTLAWNRHRTGPHCASTSTAAKPGTYQLSVVFDGVRSSTAVFQLTK